MTSPPYRAQARSLVEEVRARKQDETALAESLEQKRLGAETRQRRVQIVFDEMMAEISEWQATELEAKGQQRQMKARREAHKHRIQTTTLAALDGDQFLRRFHFAVCKPIDNFARMAMESVQLFVRNVCLEENTKPNDIAFLGIIDYAGHGTHADNFTEQLATTMSELPNMPYVVFYPDTPSAECKRVRASVASCRIASKRCICKYSSLPKLLVHHLQCRRCVECSSYARTSVNTRSLPSPRPRPPVHHRLAPNRRSPWTTMTAFPRSATAMAGRLKPTSRWSPCARSRSGGVRAMHGFSGQKIARRSIRASARETYP